jgi:hypothetical protein
LTSKGDAWSIEGIRKKFLGRRETVYVHAFTQDAISREVAEALRQGATIILLEKGEGR